MSERLTDDDAWEAALTKIRDNDPDGWEAAIARTALRDAPQ